MSSGRSERGGPELRGDTGSEAPAGLAKTQTGRVSSAIDNSQVRLVWDLMMDAAEMDRF
jgi:hypothetical protein